MRRIGRNDWEAYQLKCEVRCSSTSFSSWHAYSSKELADIARDAQLII